MDTLVKYDVAKLAKEKGFNEKCSHYFILPYKMFKPDFIAHKWNKDLSENQFQFVTVGRSQPHLAGAPTQTQLAKWLREEHGIFVYPYLFMYPNDFEYKVSKRYQDVIVGGFNATFEEAFEEGLLVGLRQIKI